MNSPGEVQVAVIIPCFNDGLLLEEAVDSVRKESVELVVVDDGSTDEQTLDILERLRRQNVRVVRQENQGLSAARMTGVAATSAPYIFPLDADDILCPGVLQHCAGLLEQNPWAAFVYGDYEVFGQHEGLYRSYRHFDPWLITYVNMYPVSSLFRRSSLLEVGGWSLNSAYEDWDLWMAFAQQNMTGVYAEQTIYRRRLHGSSRMMASARKQHHQLYRALKTRHLQLFARRSEHRKTSQLSLPMIWIYKTAGTMRNSKGYPFVLENMVRKLNQQRKRS